jgi:hypothetical protein
VRLDVRAGSVGDEARLTFESAYLVSPGANQADFAMVPGQKPRLRIEFKAPSPGMYGSTPWCGAGPDQRAGSRPVTVVMQFLRRGKADRSKLALWLETELTSWWPTSEDRRLADGDLESSDAPLDVSRSVDRSALPLGNPDNVSATPGRWRSSRKFDTSHARVSRHRQPSTRVIDTSGFALVVA